jgi:signal transduction histidine kinase
MARRSAPALSSSRWSKRASCSASSRSPATSPSSGRHSLLRDAQRALRNTQQFETVGRLSRGLSHEFNNLLTTIGNALDLLSLRVGGDDARAAELLDAAQARPIGALLTRQLLVQHWPDPDPRTTGYQRADTAVAAGPATRLPAHGDAGCPAGARPAAVSTDALQLQTALANLVANAADATLEGGRILIGTALEHRLDPDADSTLQRGYVTLSVCDEGHGMAADIAERATEPFFTTKDIGKAAAWA